MSGDDEQIFKGKDEEVDWQEILALKDKDFLEKLHKADANNEEKKLEEMVKELEAQFEHITKYKVNKEDARADVDNLMHLFEVTQALLEVKATQLDAEVDAHKSTRQKMKKLKEEVNEQGERISEQDNLIEELQRDMKASFGGTKKGDAGPGDSAQFRRMEAELNSAQKRLEAVSEDLNQAKKQLDTERDKAIEATQRANKENLENTKLTQEVKELTGEIENLRQRQAEEEKKNRKTRAQAQKTTKEAYRFVREITELSNSNEQLEQELKATKEELELVTNDSLHIKDQLEETQVQLQNTERMKEELEQDMQVLREKVAEMTLREDEREEEHEQLMQEITTKVRALKSELNETHATLEGREQELREATVTIKKLEQEKRASEVERRLQEADERIARLEDEKAEQVEQYIQAQRENKMLKEQVAKGAEDEKKQVKALQAWYRARENEVRASFFERQEEMADAERRVTEMAQRMAAMEETNMELEQHITDVEKGHFRLPEATAKIKEQKRELEAMHNRLSAKTKEHNEALRKIEDLHEEVLLLRDRVKAVDKTLEKRLGAGGGPFKGGLDFMELPEEERNGPTDWGRGFRLDISAYKVKTAMELEKAKAVTLQLEREVEALEVERLEMKAELRHRSILQGERAAKLGMSASEIEKLDAYAEQLKSGQDGPPTDQGLSQGEKSKLRKLTERVEKQDKELREKQKEISAALDTIEKLNQDIQNRENLHDTIEQLQAMQRNFASAGYQQQLRQRQVAEGDQRRRKQSQGEEEQAMMPALPLLGMGTAGMGEFIKAFREADLGEQPMVEVTIVSAKVAKGAHVYAAVTILPQPGQRGSKYTQAMAGPNPQFNDTFTLPVAQRDTDILSIRLYEARDKEQKRDEDKDLLIGKMEIKVQSWARVSDSESQRGVRWTGHVSQQWQDLFDTHGDLVRVEDDRGGGGRVNAQVRVSLTFRETARRKVELLERDLDAERGMSALSREALEAKSREADGLRDDLRRKLEDLDHVTQERNKLRDDAQRARMNGALNLGGMQMTVIATNADGSVEQPELADAYTKLLEDFSDHNRFLIQALDDLSKREDELAAVQEEVQRSKEDMDVLRVQQVLLYKEHTGQVGGLHAELNKVTKAWGEAEKMREVADSKATKALLLLEEMKDPSKDMSEERRLRLDAERRLIVLQAEQDVAERQVQIKREEEQDLRTRYDALVVDMAKQEHRLKQRIGRLDRSRWAADRRLQECQQQLSRSVPKEELTKLREEHLQLKERYASTVNRESKDMLEKAAEAGLKAKAERLERDSGELELKLSEASDRASALTARLEFLALQDGPPEQQLLAALSDKLVKLEVSERNAVRRSELALERMRGMEGDAGRLQERIQVLEDESVDNAARIHELEERDRELRTRLDGSISAKEATELRTKVSEQDFELAELKISVSKFQEIADLATDQAKAMEELHTVHLEELQAMRAYLSQVQAESDEQAEHGLLQRKLMDKQRQVHELTSKVANMDRELVRMDEYVVRLEDTLERKAESLHKQSDDADAHIKGLERAVDDLRGKAAGQIPLEKADQWAASLRELTEQKQLAGEELAAARKEKRERDDKAEALQIQLEIMEDVVRQLKASEGDDGRRAGQVDKLIGQAEEVTRLKLENLRLSRQTKQLQEREAHLEQMVAGAEKEVRRVEEQLVVAEQLRQEEGETQDLKSQVDKLKARVQELESEPRGGYRGSPGKQGRAGGFFGAGGSAGLRLDVSKGGGLGAAEGRAVDQEAIMAMQEEVNRLLGELQEREKEVEELNQQLDEATGKRGEDTRGRGDGAGAEDAAEHTQQVARLTIDRLEKNNKRKTDLIARYQKQLQEAREEYVKQKEADNAKIAKLTEDLATKTHESILTMRQRTTVTTLVDPAAFQSPTAVAEADQLFAEKDEAIRGLTKERQTLKQQIDELREQKEDAEEKLKLKIEEVERLTKDLGKAEGRKPSQVLETLVFKLKKQLAEKEKKQEEMKSAIEKLGQQMEEAAELQAKTELAAMAAGGTGGVEAEAALTDQVVRAKQQADMLDGKLKKARSELSGLKTQLEAEKTRVEELTKKKDSLEEQFRKQSVELGTAKKRAREAQEALKKLEAEASKDGQRIGQLESELRKAQTQSKGGEEGGGGGGSRPRRGQSPDGREGGREEATRRWEAEKRLEAKVERLTGKLRDQRRELEAMEKQHATEKDKMGKEMDKLKERIDFLEDAKKQLKAKLRGDGPSMDSEEVLTRVREAERKNLELEEQNERLRQELQVEGRAKDNVHKTTTEGLQNTIRELTEDLKARDAALAAQDEESSAKEKVREVRRLEGEVGKLREKVEELEGELLRSQNEVIRLTFESDHADLRLQRWRRRVRELEALPLAAVGKAESVDAGEKKGPAKTGGKPRTKEDDEQERFVRSTRAAMEKLHKENESLRANAATNVKYMDTLRELKTVRAALADRDRELKTLNEKLTQAKTEAGKKASVDEENRKLKKQFNDEKARADHLGDELREKDRLVSRLEADVREARDALGGETAAGERVRAASEETEELREELRRAKRELADERQKGSKLKMELREEKERTESALQKFEDEVKRGAAAAKSGPVGGGGGASDAQVRDLKEQVRRLQQENDDLRGELNSLDPAFFDEIEDLKYNHNEMAKLVDRYETLLQYLSEKYAFEFTPLGAPAGRRSGR